MKIALLGAGAVGGYFIWGFENSQSSGREFTVVAEGERRERLIKNGVKVNGKIYHPDVKTPDEAGKQDLVIVAVKGNTLRDAVTLIPPLVGEDTAIISMLNGAESEELITQAVGPEHVLHSIILIASRRADGEIVFDRDYNTTVCYGAHGLKNGDRLLKKVADVKV